LEDCISILFATTQMLVQQNFPVTAVWVTTEPPRVQIKSDVLIRRYK